MNSNLNRVWSNQLETVVLGGVFHLSGATRQDVFSGGKDLTCTRQATGSFRINISGSVSEYIAIEATLYPNSPADVPLRAIVSGSFQAGSGSYVEVDIVSTSGSAVDATTTKVDSAGSSPGGGPRSRLGIFVFAKNTKVPG